MSTNGGRVSERRIQRRFLKTFGALRKEYAKFHSPALISSIIDYLHEGFDLNNVEHLRKAPWVQLLLVRWILTDPDFGRSTLVAKPGQVIEIMNKAWKLNDKGRLPSEYPSIQLFMRSIAFQQFPYQERLALDKIGRQWALFAQLPEDSLLQKRFVAICGLSIRDFLSLAFLLAAKLLQNPTIRFNKGFFGPVVNEFGESTITAFLGTLSAEFPEVRSALAGQGRDGKHHQELLEYSPLSQWPLLISRGQYLSWYPTLLFRRLETFIYDVLRASDPAEFMDKFGSIFEDYVGRAIEDSGASFLREEDLIPLLEGGKCVDFLIHEREEVVLVDAKAVEIASIARSTADPRLVRDRTKGTLLKAIEQAYSVWSKREYLPLQIGEDGTVPYVIVVTFKEHYLGNGLKYSMAVADEDIRKIQAKYVGANIPLENIFFLTIDDLDYLSEAVRLGKLSYADALRHAAASDEDPKTAKFTFTQSILELRLGDKPDRVKSCIDELTARLEGPLIQAQ